MSLRTRLLLAVGAVALAALLLSGIGTYSALRSFLLRRADGVLQATHANFERTIKSGRCPTSYQRTRFGHGLLVEVKNSNDVIICSFGSAFPRDRALTPAVPRLVSVPPAPLEVHNSANQSPPHEGPRDEPSVFLTVGSLRPSNNHFRLRVSQLPNGRQLIIAEPLTQLYATMGRLLAIEIALMAAALAASMGLGWGLVRAGLRPLAQVQDTAAAIASGGLGEKVPGANSKTEIGRLASTLNVMLERLEAASDQKDQTEKNLRASQEQLRRFVADASHELRTPIAAVAAYAELFERGARDNPKDLARVMSGIRSETARMSTLVQDLLALARLDEGLVVQSTAVEIVSIAAQAVETAMAVAPQWPVSLVASEPIELMAAEVQLRQVLDNLLSNVRAHTPPGTQAQIRISRSYSNAKIEVSDNGPGLQSTETTKVFERFYREDPSRSRASGGAGLGLAIVAAIVDNLGGQVLASSTAGGGATFSVHLPLSEN